MFKLVISSLVISSAIVANSASVDWTIDLGKIHNGDNYYVIGENHIYDAQFGLMTNMYQDNDWKSMSYSYGKLNAGGAASFSMTDKDYIFVLVKVNGGYTWTQPMWSLVGRDLTVNDFDVQHLPGEFYSLGSGSSNFGAVPEPDSVILMMIGMAILSLKRRHT